MAGITLEQAQANLDAGLAAMLAIIEGGVDSVEVFGKKVSVFNLTTLQNTIDFWNKQVIALTAKGTRTGRRARGGTIAGPPEEA